MTTSVVLSRIESYVRDSFLYTKPDYPLGPSEPLLAGGILDSMGVLELTSFIAEEFRIVVADEEITEANLGSLDAIASYVDRKRAAHAA